MIHDDFSIVDGAYDPEKKQYTSFHIRQNARNAWEAPFEATRAQVIDTMEDGYNFEVFQADAAAFDQPPRRLFIVVAAGQKYIRADQQNIAADYIWE